VNISRSVLDQPPDPISFSDAVYGLSTVFTGPTSRLHERIAAGNPHHAGKHKRPDSDVLGKSAAGRFEPGGGSSSFITIALSKRKMAARMALETRHVVMQSNPVSYPETAHSRACANNRSGRFVAKDARGGHSAILDLFDVRGADSTGGDLDQQLAWTDSRNRHTLDAQIVNPTKRGPTSSLKELGHE
jgi:hypothetical protein